jgi:hypothetical protein
MRLGMMYLGECIYCRHKFQPPSQLKAATKLHALRSKQYYFNLKIKDSHNGVAGAGR